MTKNTTEFADDVELEITDDFDNLADDDYVFIVRADGTLKSVIFPTDDVFTYSDDLLAVFSTLGVDNPDELTGNHTLH